MTAWQYEQKRTWQHIHGFLSFCVVQMYSCRNNILMTYMVLISSIWFLYSCGTFVELVFAFLLVILLSPAAITCQRTSFIPFAFCYILLLSYIVDDDIHADGGEWWWWWWYGTCCGMALHVVVHCCCDTMIWFQIFCCCTSSAIIICCHLPILHRCTLFLLFIDTWLLLDTTFYSIPFILLLLFHCIDTLFVHLFPIFESFEFFYLLQTFYYIIFLR